MCWFKNNNAIEASIARQNFEREISRRYERAIKQINNDIKLYSRWGKDGFVHWIDERCTDRFIKQYKPNLEKIGYKVRVAEKPIYDGTQKIEIEW